MPKVYNKYHKDAPPGSIFVGRPTKWGNPFTHLVGHTTAKFTVETREQSVEAFEKWILEQPELMAALPELKGKDLVCFCAPKRCHANVLLELANKEEQ